SATEFQPDQPEWDDLAALFPPMLGSRQIFDVSVDLVQTSCGYGVPFLEFAGDRPVMEQWAAKKGPDGLLAYHLEQNVSSIDGLPTGLRA
ncbi:MAG: hypothetical protein J2P23_08240, partial [Microlunatus sp.]|nr:hypothetical protein [Microlunatus sp.]